MILESIRASFKIVICSKINPNLTDLRVHDSCQNHRRGFSGFCVDLSFEYHMLLGFSSVLLHKNFLMKNNILAQ